MHVSVETKQIQAKEENDNREVDKKIQNILLLYSLQTLTNWIKGVEQNLIIFYYSLKCMKCIIAVSFILKDKIKVQAL